MHAAAGGGTAMAMRSVPVSSTVRVSPGAMIVVDSRSSMIAGPCDALVPGRSA